MLFECVGGDLCGKVFKLMPPKSTMVVYGNLTRKDPTFESTDFRWNDKNITSLVLFRWLAQLTSEERQKWFKQVVDDIQSGAKIFGTKVIKEVPLEEWKTAMEESEKVAGEGKILLNCRRQQ